MMADERNKRSSAGHGAKKPRKLDAFVSAMLSHAIVEAAAAAAGIGSATAYRWLQHPDVVQRLADARRDVMKSAMAKLQRAATEAVDRLCEVQRDGESESARVSAARCILETALHTVEVQDVEERIEKLEAIVKAGWKGVRNDEPGHAQAGISGGVNGAA
jgi:hypothetical protein